MLEPSDKQKEMASLQCEFISHEVLDFDEYSGEPLTRLDVYKLGNDVELMFIIQTGEFANGVILRPKALKQLNETFRKFGIGL